MESYIKRKVSLNSKHVGPGFSGNGKVIVNSSMGLWYPEKEMAINVPINRSRNESIKHCPIVSVLLQEGATQEATLIEATEPTVKRFAYGFTQCVSCVLSDVCPNRNNYLRLLSLVEQ